MIAAMNTHDLRKDAVIGAAKWYLVTNVLDVKDRASLTSGRTKRYVDVDVMEQALDGASDGLFGMLWVRLPWISHK